MNAHSGDASDDISVDLSDDERQFLVWGLRVWGGLAYPSLGFMQSMGFSDGYALADFASDLGQKICRGERMSRTDWTLGLRLAEIGFASDIEGAGLEWQASTGISDWESITTLRSIQLKMIDVRIRYARPTGEPHG